MALQVWLPLTGDFHNQGLDNEMTSITGTGCSFSNDGKIGSCLKLGYTNNLTVPSLAGAKQLSIAYWCRVDTATSTNWLDPIRFYSTDGSTTQYSRQEFYTNCTQTGFWYAGGSLGGWNGVEVGVWNHYAITFNYETGVVEFYINGEKKYTQTNLNTTHYVSGINIRLGDSGLAISENDMRIYDHVLSAKEISELAKGLVLHYPLSMPGQENLLSVQISDNHWVNWGSSAWNTNNLREKILGDDGRTWAHIVQNTSDGYGGYACDPAYNSIVIDSSKRYTWSCLAKAGTKENAEIILWCHWRSTEGGANLTQNSKKFLLTSNPQRISWTLPQYTNDTYTVNRINLMMGTSGTGNNEIYFTDVKFEEGEIATPWIPNPADAEYSALGFDDGIEYDVSGYGRNGTKVGTITYDADTPRYNTSAYFNGSSDIRSAKSSFGWFDFKEGTVAAWFKPANTTQTWASVGVQNDGGAGSRSFSVCNYSGKAGTVVGYDSSWGYLASDFSMAANTWYHLCATITNGDTVKLYVNGELVQTRTVTNTTGTIASTTQFAVGVDLPGSDERFTGQLSDVRFYATALSPNDILELYHTSASLADNGTLMAYEFNEV